MQSIFWRNMAPVESNERSNALEREITRAFGNLDQLRAHFLAAGTSIQGSGWAALSWEPLSRSLVVQQILDHHDNAASSSLPILVMDMWEHAYYLQYRNEKNRWAKAFWDLIDWKDVDDRLWRMQNADMPHPNAHKDRIAGRVWA